ncbi:MAG: PAS domain S-box protein [Caldisericia bacterium]|nr:PAS domain S-box protein [Caldisericia bacterium]
MDINNKNFKDNLKDSFEKFKRFFYSHPEPLVFIDKNGFIIDINPKFTEVFGFSLEELKGKNINDSFFLPENLYEEGKELDEIAIKTGYINFETKRKKKDGSIIPVSISGSPISINGDIKGIIGLYIDLSEKKKREEEFKYLSTHDNLTGLYNKSFFEERFKIEKERAKRYNEKFAVLFVDLFDFKYINDKYGHSFGDRVLKEISKKFLQNIRKTDLIARAGGDEFLILITNVKNLDSLMFIIKRLIDTFESFIIDDTKLNIGLNIGISIYPDDGEELDELIKKADLAMYHSKSMGKNTFSFYSKELNVKKITIEPRKLERKFESIFNNIPIGIILFDNNGLINFANKKIDELLNLSNETIIGKNIKEILHLEEGLRLNEFFENKINEFQTELKYKIDDFETKFLKINFYNFIDKEFNVKYNLLTIQDITKEKLLNHDLKKEREFLATILENVDAIVLILNEKGDIKYINKKGEEVLGYKIDEIINKNWFDYFLPDNIKNSVYSFFENIIQEKPTDYKIKINPIKTRSGEIKVVLWKNSLIYDSLKNEKLIISSGIDITNELKLQKELKEKEELLNKILDSSSEMIFVKDLEGRYIYANEEFSKKFNLSLNEIIGKRDIDLFSEDDIKKIKKIDNLVIQEKRKIVTEDTLTYGNKKFEVKITKSPLFDESGNVIGIVGYSEDITDLKEYERDRDNLIESLREELKFQENLRNISFILHSQENLKSLLNQILIEIEKIKPSTSSNIAFLEGDFLINVAIRGYEKYGIEDYVKNFKLNINEFTIERFVVENKKPYIIYDTEKDGQWKILEKTRFIKSHLIVPILVKDKLIGVIRLDSDKENTFSTRDADRLTILAGSLGLAIENIKNLEKLKNFLNQIFNLVTKITELKDPYTAGHQKNVSEISVKIAEKLGLDLEKIEIIRTASLVHDLGKIILPLEILTKPFKLTPKEYELIKEHPKFGYELLKEVEIPYPIGEIILEHHERINGSGYPKGLKGDEILFEAKIIAVADVFDAMNSHRPYRPKHSIDEIIKELTLNKGILYEPKVVDAILELYNENKLL